jgi:nucleoside-diphosphate-sugar epimerase
MRILVIGGTGNLSSDCAARLHAQGHEILVLTRGSKPVPEAYRAIQADRRDPESLRAALQDLRIDAAIDFIAFEPAEIQATVELLKGKVEQFVFISTTVVYQRPPCFLPMTETHPLGNAFSEYGRLKQACETYLLEQHARHGFPVTLVRPSHTYSPIWIPGVVTSTDYTFASRLEQGKPVFIPGDGDTPWTLTASEDFAVGLAGLLGHPEAIGTTVQITGDEVLTWNQIYAEIAAALGVEHPEIVKVPVDFICERHPIMEAKLKGDKSQPGVFDNSKIKALVPAFATRTRFREGIRKSVAWFRENPENRTINPTFNALIEDVVTAWRHG